MKRNSLHGAEKYIEEKQRKKRWYRVVAGLACVTVLCTVYVLIRSGIAMESNHIHSSECYTQVTSVSRVQLACNIENLQLHENVQLHKHSSACYDSEGNLVCGYADFVVHKHDDYCYDENGNLLCTLPEVEEHEHTDECYMQVEETTDISLAQLEEEAAETEGEETAMAAEEAVVPEPVLVCGKPEIILHEHTDSCRDEMGNLVCGKVQVLAHQHTEACFKTVEEPVDTTSLTCTLPEDESHTHGPLCYGTWELTCGKEERQPAGEQQESPESTKEDAPGSASEDISSSTLEDISGNASEDITSGVSDNISHKKKTEDITSSMQDEESEADKPHVLSDPSQAGLKISLLYGDQKEQSEHPDGQSYYTHSTMSGYIKLEPNNLTDNLENVTVTLTIPKEYVEKDSINIPKFNTNSQITKYEITSVTEEGENYCISIHFSAYDKTQTLELPFALSFLDDKVPDNYELEVKASVSQDDTLWSTTSPNIYKPQYKDWGISKFVNSNREDAFQRDGAEAIVTPEIEGGNPYLGDDAYVKFAFRVNNVINLGSDLADYRDATSVTLTDTLPRYQDKDGKWCTAAFDAGVNPGWTLSDDGTKVTKTYTGTKSSDVLNQIYNDTLQLRFPGLKLDKTKENGSVYANLKNEVDLVAIPSNMVTGETKPTANDPLNFVISDDLGTKGKFTKVKLKGNIYDLKEYKTNPYPWRIRLSNDGMQPLRNIRIEDHKIVGENGEVVLKGLDEALKFVKLESDLSDSIPATGKSFADIVDKVVAYYTDGSKDEIPIADKVDASSGNFLIEFDKAKECNGYDIIFQKDYEMAFKEAASFKAYTVYRNPDQTCVPEGTEKIYYENNARSVNEYTKSDGTPVEAFLWSWSGYDMFPIKEELKISKETWNNEKTENQMIGGEYAYYIYLRGSLLSPEQKKYGDIRIVDLLPNEVDFVKTTNGWGEYTNSEGQSVSGDRIKPDIIENYKNSGRTAVIYHITYEKLTERWKEGWNGLVSFVVRIREDAHPGTMRNDAYVVGDNLEEYNGSTGYAEDIYDLDNDGSTNDKIGYSHSDATIIAARSIYAEKFIAPAGSDNWSKQGLSLKAGSDFDYRLKVTNETDDKKTGLVVYDTLPAIGDKGVFGEIPRNSEFRVHLRNAIEAPNGYTAYYTTQEVVNAGMENMINQEEIWVTANEITDWSQVTAFQLVADEGTMLSKDSPFEVRIPARIPTELSAESMEKLKKKVYQDQQSGTMAYLEAFNTFGYKTDGESSVKESNNVWTRIPFAGFIIKKVDGKSGAAIEGATFTLTKESGTAYTATSDENGFLEFRDLTEGTYTLEETKVPMGYVENHKKITVTITQNAATMEYKVEFEDHSDEAGNKGKPLCIENVTNDYELPATGGFGTVLYTAGGLFLIAAASLLLYLRTKRKRE